MNEELEDTLAEAEAAEVETILEGSGHSGESKEAGNPVEENFAGEGEEADPVVILQNEVLRYRDEALRRAAELDNYRKRMAKELEEGRKYSNQRLLMELLPVLDNFGMGMQMAEQEQGSLLYQGMAMVQGQLQEFFASQGVKPVELAVGSDFDPNFQEAVSQEPSAEVEAGKVLRVVRGGYFLGDRLLRPANVIVAQAPVVAEGEFEQEEGN